MVGMVLHPETRRVPHPGDVKEISAVYGPNVSVADEVPPTNPIGWRGYSQSPAAPSVACTDLQSVPYQATGAAAFFDDDFNRLIGVDGAEELAVYVICIGARG